MSFHQPQLHVLFSPRVLSASIAVSFKLWFFNQLRLLVLFCPKVLSTSIGVYFKWWIFTSHSFMFYLVLGFYPLVLEFLSSCEFVKDLRLFVLFGRKILSDSIGVSFKFLDFITPGFMFYLVLGLYPIVLEFISSCEFSPATASCFI